MRPWYLDKKNWLQTLSGECCSTTELMARLDENNQWEYALVMYHNGHYSLKCQWVNNTVIFPPK